MAQIANQMVLELFFIIKIRKEKKEPGHKGTV